MPFSCLFAIKGLFINDYRVFFLRSLLGRSCVYISGHFFVIYEWFFKFCGSQ